MRFPSLHSWSLTPSEAIALQKELAADIDVGRPLIDLELVAGSDVSCNRFSKILHAGVVVWRASDGAIVETGKAVGESRFPYIPGLLSFREAPVVLRAFAKLRRRPDAVILDGQGFAHPRRFGLACHLGLWLGLPCLGCAKTRLVGTAKEPGKRPGALAPLRHHDEVIGSVVRTKKGTKPLFVSAGHLIDLASAVRLVLACCRGYRLPEPMRLAHLQVNEQRKNGEW